MLLGAITDFSYRCVYLIHILSVVVAFAPAFVVPLVQARMRRGGEPLSPALMGVFRTNSLTVHGPALVITGLAGALLVVLSDEDGRGGWSFSDPWITIGFTLWFILLAVVFGGTIPAERKAAQGDDAAEQRLAALGGVVHLLFFLQLITMIWKPGA